MVGSPESDLTYVKIVHDYDVEISIGFLTSTGLCIRRGSKTLERAHPEKPTPSGFRAKNYKIRLG